MRPEHCPTRPIPGNGHAARDLLLVGVGRMGRPYLLAAQRLGVPVHAVEVPARVERAEGARRITRSPGELDESWAAAAWTAAAEARPAGVLAFSEPHVLAAALVADDLGLPGPSLRASVLSRDKALQRGRFAACGLRQPDHVLTANLAAATEWASSRFPVVVKPLSSAGSEGVELVADDDGFADAVARRDGAGPLLVEEAVRGPEYSWEALVADGAVWFANITAKETTGPPAFVETCHRTAAALQPEVSRQVHALGAGVVAALGLGSGLVHLEFRLADDGPTIMEVAVRTPGDYLMDLLGWTYGLDWFEAAVRLSMGMPLPEPPDGPQAYAASWFATCSPGEVIEVLGLDAVRAHPAVVHAEVTVGRGDVVAPLDSSADRVGHVLVKARTPEEREAALAFVRTTLTVRTRAALAGTPRYHVRAEAAL